MYERERSIAMKLFHASSLIIDTPDVYHSRPNLDFGKGFYLTLLYVQAKSYAQRFLFRNKEAYINEYRLDDDLKGFSTKTFGHYDSEWLDFVSNCRKGIQPEQFDLVEGGIANDKVFNTIDLYFSGLISRDEALGRLAYEKPNHQLCILNQTVITNHLHFIKAEKITRSDNDYVGK